MGVSDGGSSGYYRDTFRNGQSRCRSNSTGRFATNSSCSGEKVEFSTLDRLDLTYATPMTNDSSFLLGAAVDINDTSQPYGLVGWTWQKNNYVKALIKSEDLIIKLGTSF